MGRNLQFLRVSIGFGGLYDWYRDANIIDEGRP